MKTVGRILIADDEETFLESTAALLEREGYTIQTARTGAEALAAIEANPCDLLISDLEMPGNADLELVRRIAETAGGLPPRRHGQGRRPGGRGADPGSRGGG